MSKPSKMEKHFEEWLRFLERFEPEIAQALRAIEVFKPRTARRIFDQAFAMGEQHIENVMAREERRRGRED